jgi:PleD family two-component response regulator
MLSTEAADVTVDEALELGADGYVMKPVTLEELEKCDLRSAFKNTRYERLVAQ